MSTALRCSAPINGHDKESARKDCPACSLRSPLVASGPASAAPISPSRQRISPRFPSDRNVTVEDDLSFAILEVNVTAMEGAVLYQCDAEERPMTHDGVRIDALDAAMVIECRASSVVTDVSSESIGCVTSGVIAVRGASKSSGCVAGTYFFVSGPEAQADISAEGQIVVLSQNASRSQVSAPERTTVFVDKASTMGPIGSDEYAVASLRSHLAMRDDSGSDGLRMDARNDAAWHALLGILGDNYEVGSEVFESDLENVLLMYPNPED